MACRFAASVLSLLVGCGRIGFAHLESHDAAIADSATIDATIASDAGADAGVCAAPFVATRIATGENHACALSAGKVLCWGVGLSGQLGYGNTFTKTRPYPIADPGDFTALTTMTYGTCALRSDGMLVCFGDNYAGGLANGTDQGESSPIDTISGAVEITGGGSFMITRGSTGLLTVWGDNADGNLGLGAPAVGMPIRTETTIAGSSFFHVSAGAHHACVTNASGHAYCAGDNGSSQLGIAGVDRDVFTLVTSSLAFDVLDGGYETTCGVTSNGELYCWGRNDPVYVQGQGDTLAYPTRVGLLAGYSDVSVGFDSMCALRDGGRLYCVGDGELGALGLSDELDRDVLTEVTPGTAYSQVSVGRDFACAIRTSDSSVVCFGRNDQGQLGRGADTTQSLAVICLP